GRRRGRLAGRRSAPTSPPAPTRPVHPGDGDVLKSCRLAGSTPFSRLAASGNAGAYRGQARIERFLHPSENAQVTLTADLSEPVPTILTPNLELTEDNGWPNVEARVALALGPLVGEGPLATRPFEWGVSGLVGQIRTTEVWVPAFAGRSLRDVASRENCSWGRPSGHTGAEFFRASTPSPRRACGTPAGGSKSTSTFARRNCTRTSVTASTTRFIATLHRVNPFGTRPTSLT